MGERKEGESYFGYTVVANAKLTTGWTRLTYTGSERSDIIQVTSEGVQCMSSNSKVLKIFAGCNLPMNHVEIREIPSPLFSSLPSLASLLLMQKRPTPLFERLPTRIAIRIPFLRGRPAICTVR